MQEFIEYHMRELEVPSFAQFAERIGISRETLSRWYNTPQLPTPQTAAKVASRLGISPDEVPQFDPRGVGRPDVIRSARVEAEVVELRERVEALAASLRDLQEQLPNAGSQPGKSRRRPSRAAR